MDYIILEDNGSGNATHINSFTVSSVYFTLNFSGMIWATSPKMTKIGFIWAAVPTFNFNVMAKSINYYDNTVTDLIIQYPNLIIQTAITMTSEAGARLSDEFFLFQNNSAYNSSIQNQSIWAYAYQVVGNQAVFIRGRDISNLTI